MFASTVSKGLLDGHIWFSIFLRPKESSFTRVRRASSCLALIFLTMLTNAMFFGGGADPSSRKIVWLGNFKVNMTGIIIGILSSFIVIPPSVIIIEIFRRLKPAKLENVKKSKSKNINSVENGEAGNSDLSNNSNSNSNNNEKKKKQPFMFPSCVQYFAYLLVYACAISSSLICFFYSMMWGPKKSNEWLASMFTGFFQSVLVIQPVKAVVVALLLAAIFRFAIFY